MMSDNLDNFLLFSIGGDNMATIRSHFSFEQFEAVLQKVAHEMALDALKALKGDLRIAGSKNRLKEVETDGCSIRFFASHLSFSKHTGKMQDGLAFEIENKEFSTSNHRSKISYWSGDGGYDPKLYDEDPAVRAAAEAVKEQKSREEAKQKEKQITEFLDKLMQGIKPEPRFKLAEHAKSAAPS
jgi:hypothetical protein